MVNVDRAIDQQLTLSNPEAEDYGYWQLKNMQGQVNSIVRRLESGKPVDLFHVRIETKSIKTQLDNVNAWIDRMTGYNADTGAEVK